MIYLDLDETLVLALPQWWMEDARPPGCVEVSIGDDELFYAAARPLAKSLITCARELDEVSILTMATHVYAVAVCNTFDFGFSDKQIIGRDDFLQEVQLAYGRDLMLKDKGIDPSAILVDNQSPTEQYAQTKMRYLGIKADRYITIRSFTGTDPNCFEKELNKIQCRLQELKS